VIVTVTARFCCSCRRRFRLRRNDWKRPSRHSTDNCRSRSNPRDPSWICREIKDLLTEYGTALVWADREGRSAGPLWTTADWRYLRLHHGRHGWRYDQRDLRRWAHRMADADAGYVYANNDPGGAVVDDARRVRDLVAAVDGG
jgi:uncharacterized protein YecE (DUF72 family)